MALSVTRCGHSCIRLERDGGGLVVDPGVFTDLDTALAGITDVLVTHEHADHVDAGAVAARTRSGLRVWGPAAVVAALTEAGADPTAVTTVSAGDSLVVGGLSVEVLGEWHAVIHPDLPRAHNVAYLVEGVLHPGDSFPRPDAPVALACVPVGGPWLKLSEAIDYARATGAAALLPIHDAQLSAAGRELVLRLLSGLGGAPVLTPDVGETIDVPTEGAHA